MSWITALNQVYDNSLNQVEAKDKMLLPISYSTQKVQIEVYLNENGDFIRAARLADNKQMTAMPVTEDSAARSNGIVPGVLCDKLIYLAGDFDQYFHPKKRGKDYFDAFLSNMHDWIEKGNAPEDIKVIYRYLLKGNLITDLKKAEAFEKEEDMVRFVVEYPNESVTIGSWEKPEVIESFENYYVSKLENSDICYATGEDTQIATKAPFKIRNPADKAKIISANSDERYFGRFIKASDAAQIGYITSQKVHNALRWLIGKQGYKNGSECIVCFSVKGNAIPPIIDDDKDIFFDEDDTVETGENYAKRVNKAIAGYLGTKKLDEQDQIVVMAVDTASGADQGRLAITFFTEMVDSEFYDNITKWYNNCSWRLKYKIDNKVIWKTGTPNPKSIIEAAYGIQNDMDKEILQVNDKLLKKEIDRILPCIVQNKQFPKSLMETAVHNLENPLRFSISMFKDLLSRTCALIKICHVEEGRGETDMALNKDNNDRSYLFGRLLAILEKMELDTYSDQDKMGKRRPNAIRYWAAYSKKPAKTFQLIRENLVYYIAQLDYGKQVYYQKLVDEIMMQLKNIDGFTNIPLNENYILGYYCQNADFYKKSTNDEEE